MYRCATSLHCPGIVMIVIIVMNHYMFDVIFERNKPADIDYPFGREGSYHVQVVMG
jgi:hypothetical protein